MRNFNRYRHLEQNKVNWKYDWKKNLFKRTLPTVVWENQFLSNFLSSIELILVKGFSSSSRISKYFKF